jgi:Domain of unknown function DUF29
MSDLYDEDILAWSEQQSDLLRRMAAGEQVNERVDWENVAEEIESVGRGELRACQSLLMQALLHQLKMTAWPNSRYVPGWEEELIRFRQEAADAYSPSMRQRLEIDRIYKRALQRLPKHIEGEPPLPVPATCPVTLDELLADD